MDPKEYQKQGGENQCPPVLFLIFNRPEMSQRVFERIREARPSQLFIAADGPRSDKTGEEKFCEKTRTGIIEKIDWPCETKTLFRAENLGCKVAVSSAIDWFFEHVDAGIILEDDCRPDLSFFPFCETLLEKYGNNQQIMMISGNCHLPAKQQPEASYYFSEFTYIWGWATWKQAWEHMDLQLKEWPAFKQANRLPSNMPGRMKKWWKHNLNLNHGRGSSWAIAWQFSCWNSNGLSINPATNLVSHIDTTGTHMKPYDPLSGRPATSIKFPLKHPAKTTPDKKADRQTEQLVRRSFLKNLQLIARYLLLLPFNKQTSLRKGINQLISSLHAEIKSRRALSKS